MKNKYGKGSTPHENEPEENKNASPEDATSDAEPKKQESAASSPFASVLGELPPPENPASPQNQPVKLAAMAGLIDKYGSRPGANPKKVKSETDMLKKVFDGVDALTAATVAKAMADVENDKLMPEKTKSMYRSAIRRLTIYSCCNAELGACPPFLMNE